MRTVLKNSFCESERWFPATHFNHDISLLLMIPLLKGEIFMRENTRILSLPVGDQSMNFRITRLDAFSGASANARRTAS